MFPSALKNKPSKRSRLTPGSGWRQKWKASLRFRLLALGLMPLLVAFPFVIAVVVVVGGDRANAMLTANLRSNLAGSHNYLDQLRLDTGLRISQLAHSERMIHLVGKQPDRAELDQMLNTASRGSGLDFLIIADPSGVILGSSTGVKAGSKLPDSNVIRQALIGLDNSAFERFDAEQAAVFSPRFLTDASVTLLPQPATGPVTETRFMLINAAAHFPLTINTPDAILVGGILLNNNSSLIERMRNIIYPVGSLPGDADGMAALYLDNVMVAISRQRQQGQRAIGIAASPAVTETVISRGQPWLGQLDLGGQSHHLGYEAISNGDGQRIGMMAVGFPAAPYQREAMLMLGMLIGLFAVTLLAISVMFLGAGRDLSRRLARISATVAAVRSGDRQARVNLPVPGDEVGQLAEHFDVLLNTIEQQNAQQQAAQQAIAQEASRRRALFEHERDGVVILNTDGSVFEANPKCAAMLGYSVDELRHLHVGDWDAQHSPEQLQAILDNVASEGRLFETVHRRKDGHTYIAEVSVSRVTWGDQTFTLATQRDISQRKAVELELENYRLGLETLVQQRTKELNDRSGQLNAIFALSPDGFVSFDDHHAVNFVNQSFLRMTGLTLQDLMGCSEAAFSELLARRCLPSATFPSLAQLRVAGQKSSAGTHSGDSARRFRFELNQGGNRVIEVGLRVSEASNVSQVLYFRDITRESEVEQMKSEFLSTAAHELRTPMASIYGYAELLLSPDFDADTQREMVSTIYRQAELMSSIINELLDLARIEARRGKDFVIEQLTLEEVVNLAVAGFKPPGERQPPMVTPPDGVMLVRADRRKLQQAVLNIVSNAYKYSPKGGSVQLHYRRQHTDIGERVGIEVSDQGIGMTEAQRSRVCERFYRADSSGKIPGTGLGMSIVQEIIALHHGEVAIASEPGVGTTVTLWLPGA